MSLAITEHTPAASEVASVAEVAEVKTNRPPRRWWWLFLAAVLLFGAYVYLPVRHFEFINFDDNLFVDGNPFLKKGITPLTLEWAFNANLTMPSKHAEYFIPLTLISRLIDAQLYGINSGAFHVTSALIHLINTILLGCALGYLTGYWNRSAIVALFFLVHPLNAEPVCWLSARKDILSATFFFVTLLAYAHYIRRQNIKRYLLVFAAFTACLLSKPMGVSFPFVLLLLDWWPLNRWKAAGSDRTEWLRLIAEKIPLILMAIGSSVLAVVSQKDWGAFDPMASLPFSARVENAILSYGLYLRRVFWPSDLSIFYPHPGSTIQLWQVGLAFAVLAAGGLAAIYWRNRAPYALVGYLWFGIVLGPVIGLVQIGGQAMADRYAYPSVLGIFIIVVWGVAELLHSRPNIVRGLAFASVAVMAFFGAKQALTYHDSITVFRHALAVTTESPLAHLNLACALEVKGELAPAKAEFLRTLKIDPENGLAWNDLAHVEDVMGDVPNAVEHFKVALKIKPDNHFSLLYLGRFYNKNKRPDVAEQLFRRLQQVDAGVPQAYNELGDLYAKQDRWEEAVQVWQTCIHNLPEHETAHARLADAEAHRAAQLAAGVSKAAAKE